MMCGFLQQIEKDPNAILSYTWDWSDWLTGGDTIAVATFVIPAGITSVAQSSTVTTATIKLSGGSAGSEYDVTCRVTTAGGEIDDRTVRFVVKNR